MNRYQEMIIEDTNCTHDDAVMIEQIMREDVFHSTLDWQSRANFRKGARDAIKMLNENRLEYEEYFSKTREFFKHAKAETK